LPLPESGLPRWARKDEHCVVRPFAACPDRGRGSPFDAKVDVSLFPVNASPDSVGAGLVPALTLVTIPGGYKTLPYTFCAMAAGWGDHLVRPQRNGIGGIAFPDESDFVQMETGRVPIARHYKARPVIASEARQYGTLKTGLTHPSKEGMHRGLCVVRPFRVAPDGTIDVSPLPVIPSPNAVRLPPPGAWGQSPQCFCHREPRRDCFGTSCLATRGKNCHRESPDVIGGRGDLLAPDPAGIASLRSQRQDAGRGQDPPLHQGVWRLAMTIGGYVGTRDD